MADRNDRNDRDVISEQFFAQIPESIKLLFDLTARMDERVKVLIQKAEILSQDIKNLEFEITRLENQRLAKIESQMELIESFKNTTENRWKMALDIFWKIAIIVAGAFLVYKLGLK